jgi:hypothetical protein
MIFLKAAFEAAPGTPSDIRMIRMSAVDGPVDTFVPMVETVRALFQVPAEERMY